MTGSRSKLVAFVALTLLGAAAIVPALLARRAFAARSNLALAEDLRAGWNPSESRASGGNRAIANSNEANGPRKTVDSILSPPRPTTSTEGIPLFPKDEIEQASDTQHRPSRLENSLLPPISVSAVLKYFHPEQETGASGSQPAGPGSNTVSQPSTALKPTKQPALGVLVTWIDNPASTPGSVLRSVVYRWRDRETPTVVKATDEYEVPRAGNSAAGAPTTTPPTTQHEFLDSDVCENAKVTYAVRTIQLDRVEGIEVRRSALSSSVAVSVPECFRFDVSAFAKSDSAEPIVPGSAVAPNAEFQLGIVDFRTTPPSRVEILANAAKLRDVDIGVPTIRQEIGWQLIAVESEVRQEAREVPIPVFNADGTRRVDSGKPASVMTRIVQSNAYPRLRLRNRCGSEIVLQATASPEAKK